MSSEPIGEGRNDGNHGLAAASSTTSTGSPAFASGRGTAVRRGWTPCRGPSSVQTRPSAWKPASADRKPRSITASTSAPTQASGTVAVNRNQVVPHGRPHAPPSAKGS